MGKIIWLASYPKSGNTWTRAFLLHLFEDPDAPFSLDDLARMSPLDASRLWFEKAAERRNETFSDDDVPRLRGPAQGVMADRAAGNTFVKTHSAIMVWKGHPTIDFSVTAGAVYMVRNPLDIVASYAAHSGNTIDQIIAAMTTPNYVTPGPPAQVPQLLGNWSQNVSSWTAVPNPALHVMKYEDMVNAPTEAFSDLARFLGLNPPADRIARALQFSSFETLRELEEKAGFAERARHQQRFFRSGKSGGWRDELSGDQVARIVSVHREQMSRFDYVPQGY